MRTLTFGWRVLLAFLLLLTGACGGSSGDGDSSTPVPCAAPVRIDPTDSVTGSLSVSDCTVARLFPGQATDQSLLDQYLVTLPTAGVLTIEMRSNDFDAFLILFESPPTAAPIAEDDDSGGNLDAMIVVNLQAGDYLILANSATLNAVTGAYTLTTSFSPVVWTPVSTLGAPDARARHSAVWADTGMIVWGGDDGNSITKNTGGRYVPGTDSWSVITTVGAPAPRSSHTAVWTGSEMIVWGGFSGAFDFLTIGDGASYDPVADTWSALSSVNQPSPRTGHTAVWTGTEMIVWGGASCLACANAELGTGARYNPATDTWTPVSTVNAPEARFSHTAIWTGTRMIVWGGATEGGIATLTALDSGGAYDPATDTWTTLTTASAPQARHCHAATWTGTEMLVFGGQTNFNLGCDLSSVNTGGRYSPGSNSWSAMAAAPLGSSFSGPRAVWSGNRMIAWLGDGGGRYDPATDVWQGISIDNAPPTSNGHTVVWTGSKMIIWGGSFAGVIGAGAVYDPGFDDTP